MNILQYIKAFIFALIAVIGLSYASAAWNNPSANPPGGNTPTPVNVSDVEQIKTGNFKAWFLGGNTVKGNTLCIRSDCRTAWPSGGGSINNYNQLPRGTIAGYCSNRRERSSQPIAFEPAFLTGSSCSCRSGWTLVNTGATGAQTAIGFQEDDFSASNFICIKN